MAWDDAPPSKEEIKSAGSWDQSPPSAHEIAKIGNSPAEVPLAASASAGFFKSLPFASQIGAAGKIGMDVLTGITSPDDALKEYGSERDKLKGDLDAKVGAHPGVAFAGGLGGMAMMPLGTSATAMAAYGGANGLSESGGDLKQGALGAGVGAASAGLANVAAPYVQKGFEKLSAPVAQYMKALANKQSAKAMGATKATYNKLGQEGVQDLGRYGLDNKLFGNLTSSEEMLARNQAIKNAAMTERNGVYDTIDKAGASKFSPTDTAAKIDSEAGNFNRLSPLNSSQNKQLEDTLSAVNLRNAGSTGNISMSDGQKLIEELGQSAKFDASRPSGANQVAQDAYHTARTSLNDAAEAASGEVGIPGLRETLQKNNKLFSQAKTAEKSLTGQLNGELGNSGGGGLMGGATAVAAAPFTGGASLKVYAGKKALDAAGQYTNQNAALGADWLGGVVKAAPQSLGKWAPALTAAATRGGSALGATDYILQQTDPDYRQHILLMKSSQENDRDPAGGQ